MYIRWCFLKIFWIVVLFVLLFTIGRGTRYSYFSVSSHSELSSIKFFSFIIFTCITFQYFLFFYHVQYSLQISLSTLTHILLCLIYCLHDQYILQNYIILGVYVLLCYFAVINCVVIVQITLFVMYPYWDLFSSLQ